MDAEELDQKVLEYVTQIVHINSPNTMVTKYILIAECVDGEGRVFLKKATLDSTTSWDILGMFDFVLKEVDHGIRKALDEEGE